VNISVIFPAYNEAASLGPTIERALAALRPRFAEFEVIIVDDASTDATGQAARDLTRVHPEVRVIRNATNLGQGHSILVGFQHARGDVVLHNAVDYPFDLRDLDRMVPLLLAGADVVVAQRLRRSGYTSYRKLLSVVNRGLLQLLFGLKLYDYNFVQLYRREVVRAVRVQARSTGFVTPELLIRAHDAGFRLVETDVEYHPRVSGTATSGRPRIIIASLRDMFRFWWERRRMRARRASNESITAGVRRRGASSR